jgi:hypothetical protein
LSKTPYKEKASVVSASSRSTPEIGIPGFGSADIPQTPHSDFEGDHGLALSNNLDRLSRFVSARDPISLLSLFGRQYLIEATQGGRDQTDSISQPELELLQTLALTISGWGKVPTSPNNFERCHALATDCLHHYAATTQPMGDDPEAIFSSRVKIQSLFYRNSFSSEVGAIVVSEMLAKIDIPTETELGYRLSDLAAAAFDLLRLIGANIDNFRNCIGAILRGDEVERHIKEVGSNSVATSRVISRTHGYLVANNWPSDAAFQASEMGWSSVFTFTRKTLSDCYGRRVASALFDLAIRPGELANFELKRAFLGSPIRERPFVLLDDNHLFVPTPALIVSFIFDMLEYTIRNYPKLLDSYHRARANYLPEAIHNLVSEALPSAKMYREVVWHDPSSDARYENDVLAVLGHHVFIFEAKAGKLKPAARRGGLSSLKKNLKDLYIEPARQAARLENYLRSASMQPGMLVDRNGMPVEIDTGRPTIVRKFSVCLEHFAGLTATRHSFMELGLLNKGDAWAPILSIGELHMIGTHLDAEPAYFHYLCRRQTIEEQIDFMGDEQDLLSVYLTNRFCLDEKALANVRVFFLGADELAREKKTPALDRKQFNMPGWKLPFYWQRLATEIYQSGHQHRFDMLEIILNQHPVDLKGLEHRVSRWNGGLSTKEDISYARRYIGSRTFGLAMAHVKRPIFSGVDLSIFSREVLQSIPISDWPTDFLLVIRSRKKSTANYDAIHFARLQDA